MSSWLFFFHMRSANSLVCDYGGIDCWCQFYSNFSYLLGTVGAASTNINKYRNGLMWSNTSIFWHHNINCWWNFRSHTSQVTSVKMWHNFRWSELASLTDQKIKSRPWIFFKLPHIWRNSTAPLSVYVCTGDKKCARTGPGRSLNANKTRIGISVSKFSMLHLVRKATYISFPMPWIIDTCTLLWCPKNGA